MNLTLKKHKENVTYQLVPGPDHEQNWHIRITDGIFNETVVQIGSISYNDIGEDVLNYNFFIVISIYLLIYPIHFHLYNIF